MNFLNDGQPVSPEEILNARESRAQRIEDLTREHPERTILSCTLNIPGPVKAHPVLDLVFEQAIEKITEILPDFKIHNFPEKARGPELLLSTSLAADEVKLMMIALEESTPLARLYDIDVVSQGQALSRSDLSIPERPCLVCNQTARVCSRSQAHSLAEVLKVVQDLIFQDDELAPKLKDWRA